MHVIREYLHSKVKTPVSYYTQRTLVCKNFISFTSNSVFITQVRAAQHYTIVDLEKENKVRRSEQ